MQTTTYISNDTNFKLEPTVPMPSENSTKTEPSESSVKPVSAKTTMQNATETSRSTGKFHFTLNYKLEITKK